MGFTAQDSLQPTERLPPVGRQIAKYLAMKEKLDFELIVDSRRGDREAMEELFRRHYSSSLRTANRILRSEEDALEMVQSAYLKAFQHFSSFREESSFKTWITRIVMNECMVYFRNPARRQKWASIDDVEQCRRTPVPLRDPMPNPEEYASRQEVAALIRTAAKGLPETFRPVFSCCVSGFSTRDTAQALGLTIQATKTRLFRARSHMRPHLESVWSRNTVAPARASSRVGSCDIAESGRAA
jgi:RNA polymerase sigma-70 factor (ECF subfamily)